jgi:hypothetical protein
MSAPVAQAGRTTGAASEVSQCFQAVDDDSVFAGVIAKFPHERATSVQLANKSIATDAEAEALRLLMRRVRDCREKELAVVDVRDPHLGPAYRTFHYQQDQVLDYLQQQAITFGAANRLNAEARAYLAAREQVYGNVARERRPELASSWDEELQRGHSNPPPDPGRVCVWDKINILCK